MFNKGYSKKEYKISNFKLCSTKNIFIFSQILDLNQDLEENKIIKFVYYTNLFLFSCKSLSKSRI
ncbi:hypothetical protein VAMP_374n50 [Candidatus Vampirococcus lugosii]|uniref:Uncharacterized protein n=1 Tax=Candidatus Vampirococcus lugosii TaxID=2789015 RepID=A0ABS5QMG5_9BACT|nr:hypothetical protein [Candidatus Vampirococcus lugosii]